MRKVLFVATVVKTHIMPFHVPYLKWFKENGYERYPWTFRSMSANVPKPLHYGLFGSWKFPPTSAKMRHFPCHRQYIGSTN